MMRSFLLISVFCIFALPLLGQHDEIPHTSGHKVSHLRISLAIAHTYLPTSTADDKEILILPTIGLDIEYWMNHHWGIGLHNDLELLNFEVKTKDEVYIEREFPVLTTLDVLWKPHNSLVLFAGPGIEFEPSKNFFVWRLGIEYELNFTPHLDLAPIVFYDFRYQAYNTFSIGLGVGYQLN